MTSHIFWPFLTYLPTYVPFSPIQKKLPILWRPFLPDLPTLYFFWCSNSNYSNFCVHQVFCFLVFSKYPSLVCRLSNLQCSKRTKISSIEKVKYIGSIYLAAIPTFIEWTHTAKHITHCFFTIMNTPQKSHLLISLSRLARDL